MLRAAARAAARAQRRRVCAAPLAQAAAHTSAADGPGLAHFLPSAGAAAAVGPASWLTGTDGNAVAEAHRDAATPLVRAQAPGGCVCTPRR
jgi:hypothetical protein